MNFWKASFFNSLRYFPQPLGRMSLCMCVLNAYNMNPFYSSSAKLVELKELAINKGGKLLSNHYHNNKIKLTWLCHHGHEWDVRPNDIKSGQWCSVCNGCHPLSIEEMFQIAKDRGGKCLSTTYINSKEHLEWECSKGHRWFASPSGIKDGNWCEKCRKNKQLQKGNLQLKKCTKSPFQGEGSAFQVNT